MPATDAPDLSIVILNWNGQAMLRNLLRSIEGHSGGVSVQTIVSDNASSDGSPDMVAVEFPGVILLRNGSNLGFARGNNVGAAAATGRYVLFLNNDMIVRPGALAALIKTIDARPEIAVIGPRLIGADCKLQRNTRALLTFPALLQRISFLKATGLFSRAYKRYRNGSFDPNTAGAVGQLDGAALMVRREQLQQVGGWDDGFEFGGEDIDLCKRLGERGTIYFEPAAEIEHLGRISSRTNRPFTYRTYECGYARYVRKHHGAWRARLYKLLVTLDMPLRVIRAWVQVVYHSFRGQREKAVRSRDVLIAARRFLFTGLPKFWKS